MAPTHGEPSENGRSTAGADLSSADLFAILWESLADVLGTATTATLLRRASQRAMVRWPELADLSITRESLEYRYSVPAAWASPHVDPDALCALVCELWALLLDLTGPVVVQRLAKLPSLRSIVPPPEEP